MKRFICLLALLLMLVPALAQERNKDFDSVLAEARQLFKMEKYEKARDAVKAGYKIGGLNPDQQKEGQALVNDCNTAIAIRDRLEFVLDTLNKPAQGGLDSVEFRAGRPSGVSATSSAPSWCRVERVEGGKVYLQTDDNPFRMVREATVSLTVPKLKKKAVLHVVQQPRADTYKTLIVTASPRSALISVEQFPPTNGRWEQRLPSGEYRVQVKTADNYYQPKDTLVVLEDDLNYEEDVPINLSLDPLYARIKLDVIPEEGYAFDADHQPRIVINGNNVMTPLEGSFNYDDDRTLMKYWVYDDGTIPVSAGAVPIAVSAQGFEPGQETVFAQAGQTLPVTIRLKAVTGQLRVVDEGRAAEATVLLDGEEIGTVEQLALVGRSVLIGDHVVTLRREGFIAAEDQYLVTIQENRTSSVPVSMYGVNTLDVETDPIGARILLDGTLVGYSPLSSIPLREIPGQPSHVFTLSLQRDSFLTVTREIQADFSRPQHFIERHTLERTHVLKLSSDEEGLKASVRDSRKKDSYAYADRVLLPAGIELPYRDDPYYVELLRDGQNAPAYNGKLSFTESSPSERYIPSWSSAYFQILSGDFYLSGLKDIVVGADPNSKIYHDYGSLSLAKFKFIDGLSTSILHAKMLFQSDPKVPVHIPNGTKNDYIIENAGCLPALSFLFINGDFRIGGALNNYIDVDAVASYAWYPDFWNQVVSFSFASGHDLFIGAELSSRLPWVDINLKAGALMQANMKAEIYIDGLSSNNANCFHSFKIDRPVMFVISVGFSLGSHDCKGNSILRVF